MRDRSEPSSATTERRKRAKNRGIGAVNAAGEKAPNGKKLECKTCHENSTDFKLNDDGEKLYSSQLKKYFK